MDKQTKPVYLSFVFLSAAIQLIILYYYAYPFWAGFGYTTPTIEHIIYRTWCSKILSSDYTTRLICLFYLTFGTIIKTGTSKSSTWPRILIPLLAGAVAYFTAPLLSNSLAYIIFTLSGWFLYFDGSILLGRKIRSYSSERQQYDDTFPQCEELITNEFSVNIPIKYRYNGRTRDAYINVVSPQRGCMVLGTPGSGKTYSIYGPFIRQMIQKQYSLFVYDYKFPDLTSRVMNELLDNYDCYDIKPKMYIVNFDDPLHSHRFNPIHPRYLTDPIDSTEIAELIMKNVNRGENTNGDNFFTKSAQCYIDLLIWFLKIYKNGRYCTFPHLIELIGKDYRDVLEIMKRYDELEVKRNTFADAIRDQAYEQIQGQIASARVLLNRFASKTLYWTLSGDDFTLDINDPKEPKIICVGNNPKRQSIYGTTLALLTSQLFKLINVPGKQKCGVLVDELPTIYLKGLDNLIDTGRQNGIAVVIGAQDKSQLVRDYDKDESDVIFNTIGNVFAGAVKGDTAIDLSKSFGKEDREQQSYQEGGSSDHVTHSYQLRELLPSYKIEALSQGYFCGYVADTFEQHVHPKIFCGEVQAGEPPRHHEAIPAFVELSRAEIELEIEKNYIKIRREITELIASEIAINDAVAEF